MMIVLATICCRFGRWGLVKKLNFCSDIEHKVWSRFWSWSSGKIWSWSLINFFLLMFCRGYVEPKLNLGRDSEARFGQDFEAIVLWRGWCLVVEVDAWSKFWNLIKICVWTCVLNSTLGSVVPLAMFKYFLHSRYFRGIFTMQVGQD